jgi:hypothetical protein
MSKTGWKDIIERYHAATNLVHDREQFSSRLRQLRNLWGFINQLRKGSGLGRREDGSIRSTDDWWKANTKVLHQNGSLLFITYFNKQCVPTVSVLQGHSEWKKLKDGWLDYLSQLDRMVTGVAVDGSTSFVASQIYPLDVDSSDDEAADEDSDQLTPLNVGTKSHQHQHDNLQSEQKVQEPSSEDHGPQHEGTQRHVKAAAHDYAVYLAREEPSHPRQHESSGEEDCTCESPMFGVGN